MWLCPLGDRLLNTCIFNYIYLCKLLYNQIFSCIVFIIKCYFSLILTCYNRCNINKINSAGFNCCAVVDSIVWYNRIGYIFLILCINNICYILDNVGGCFYSCLTECDNCLFLMYIKRIEVVKRIYVQSSVRNFILVACPSILKIIVDRVTQN